MDTIMEIKRENPLSEDIASQNEKVVFIKNATMKSNSDTERLDNVGFVTIKTEIESEISLSDLCVQKKGECFAKDPINQVKCETVTCRNNCSIDTKTESHSQNEREFLPEDPVMRVKEYNKDDEMGNKKEIKEEPWWHETDTSPMYNDIMDGDFTAVKSSGSYCIRGSKMANSSKHSLMEEEMLEFYFNDSGSEGDFSEFFESENDAEEEEHQTRENIVSHENHANENVPQYEEEPDEVMLHQEVEPEIANGHSTNLLHMVQLQHIRRCRRNIKPSDADSGWSDVPLALPARNIIFGEIPSITAPVDATSSEFDFFENNFNKDMVKHIKQETNRYAADCIARLRSTNQIKKHSLWARWKPVTLSDMYKFFSIVIHMCLVQKSSISDYWSTTPILHSTFAARLMSRDRFKSILAMLHINNNEMYIPFGQPNYDALHKIRPYFDYIVGRFRDSLIPSENLTVCEGICAFRGRIRFRVYMKNKPEKYGMKLYFVCEANSGYVLNMEVYTGKSDDDFAIVPLFERLLLPYFSKGHTVYMDRFFTSPKVVDHLWNRHTLGVGKAMTNRNEMPKELSKAVLKKGDMIFWHRPHMMVCKWKDTKDVVVLTSKHGATVSEVTVRAKGRTAKKIMPDCILDYNVNKTGVHRPDQLVAYYPFKKKTTKWWKKLFFHLFIRGVVNSYILFKKSSSSRTSVSLHKYMYTIGEYLALAAGEEQAAVNPSTSSDRLTGRHFGRKIPPTINKSRPCRSCKVCGDRAKKNTGKWKRKETTYYCPMCDVPLCMPDCFETFHTKASYV